MPIVEIRIMQGRPKEKKQRLMRAVTDAIVDELDVPRGDVRVILTEMNSENFAVGGEPKPPRKTP